jgi:acyl-CoA thioesterase
METLKTFFQRDQFARETGIELLEAAPGRARAVLTLDSRHFNSVATVHGGVIFTLADFAFAVAANSHGSVAMAIQCSISFLKAARQGRLFADAREISRSPKLASYQVDVTDEEGSLVASFQGMAYCKKDPLPFHPAKES